jgi:hypothetical protein
MLLTAKEIRKELNISMSLWRFWKNYRTKEHYKFPEPDSVRFVDKNHPRVTTWELEWFKEWWDNRPRVGRPVIDITKDF